MAAPGRAMARRCCVRSRARSRPTPPTRRRPDMRMTRDEMDQLINRHFGFEAADDVDGVLGSLADDVRHEVIPSPMGEQTDKRGIAAFYKMLFADLKGEGVTPLRRFYGEDFVVDETLW